MASIIRFGIIVFLYSTATASVKAQEFPPKPETIKQIILGMVGDFVPGHDPRASTMTLTRSLSSPGFATSTSETFDNTPARPSQVLRIINGSIYDLKDIAIDCSYVAESGTLVGNSRSHTFLLVFPASSRRDVLLSETPTLRYSRGLACAITDFEYIGMGHPPPPRESGQYRRPSLIGEPVVNEWAIPRKVY
jgi:hypothetical protein